MKRYIVRNIGHNRGHPRVYLELPDLVDAGFTAGKTYRRTVDEQTRRITLSVEPNGSHVISGKERAGQRVPVIDINSTEALKPFEGMQAVRIIIESNRIHILPLASEVRRAARLKRLAASVGHGRVSTAATAFGGGVLDHAAHAGLKDAGLRAHLAAANEIDEDLLEHARRANDIVADNTVLLAAPIQELVQDDWALSKLVEVDGLIAGLPCSGASKAGVSKRGLECMEAHPDVGHLVLSAVMLIRRLNPAFFVLENVTGYKATASAMLLRQYLRDAGYDFHEVVLNAADFGCLEARERWFLVAMTHGIELDLCNLAPALHAIRTVSEVLEDVPLDSPEWRSFEYLKAKEVRDLEKGNGFAMQHVTPQSTRVPTLRKGVHKGGSTDPLLVHPTNPDLLRLFTPAEHARIKQVPEALIAGLGKVAGHSLLGQSVAYEPVRALFNRIGQALRRWYESADPCEAAGAATAPYRLSAAIG